MTVKELIEKLKQFDEDRPVFVQTGSVTYEEATYAEEADLCKCSYSNRYHVPLSIENRTPDVQGVVVALNSDHWLK